MQLTVSNLFNSHQNFLPLSTNFLYCFVLIPFIFIQNVVIDSPRSSQTSIQQQQQSTHDDGSSTSLPSSVTDGVFLTSIEFNKKSLLQQQPQQQQQQQQQQENQGEQPQQQSQQQPQQVGEQLNFFLLAQTNRFFL